MDENRQILLHGLTGEEASRRLREKGTTSSRIEEPLRSSRSPSTWSASRCSSSSSHAGRSISCWETCGRR